MKIHFWGVRGSIATPGPSTVKYGGNTPCLQLKIEDSERVIIIDAGTGIHALGNHLLKTQPKGQPIKIDLFITHTHWDHIIGFPFFTPIYIPGTLINVYGPITYEEDTIEKIVGGQLSYRYFPVLHSELAADIRYHQIGKSTMDLGDGLTLKTHYLNHTLLCLGYRFEYNGKAICTAYDTEPYRNIFPSDPDAPGFDPATYQEGEEVVKQATSEQIEFYDNADILIHDAQYTEEEYLASKIGWGHSSFEYAIEIAKKAHIKKLVLFHHDPLRSDKELSEIEQFHKKELDPHSNLEITLANESVELTV